MPGQFGIVYRAILQSRGDNSIVAVKTLKGNITFSVLTFVHSYCIIIIMLPLKLLAFQCNIIHTSVSFKK